MTDGPDVMAPPSSRPYDVTYFLRAPNPVGTVARLEIVDGVSGHTLASRDVAASDLRADNGWTRIGLSFAAPTSNCNRIAFRVSWTGTSNLDVGPIRVR
jgi:hypothetical protein